MGARPGIAQAAASQKTHYFVRFKFYSLAHASGFDSSLRRCSLVSSSTLLDLFKHLSMFKGFLKDIGF